MSLSKPTALGLLVVGILYHAVFTVLLAVMPVLVIWQAANEWQRVKLGINDESAEAIFIGVGLLLSLWGICLFGLIRRRTRRLREPGHPRREYEALRTGMFYSISFYGAFSLYSTVREIWREP